MKNIIEGALKVISDNYDAKVEHDNELRLIQELFEQGFEIKDPKGARKIGSKSLQQAMWKFVGKMKFLDFQLHASGRDPVLEKIISDGVSEIADKGGLMRALRDKGGTFFNLGLYGDGFIYAGTDEESKFPIIFSPVSPTNIYVNQLATGMRSGGIGRDVTEMVVIYSMTPEEAEARYGKKYPKIKKATGKIKRQLSFGKEQEREYNQERTDKKIVEIGFYYNINKQEYVVFAGAENLILDQKTGKKYPFIKDKKPYIPIIQFICNPSSEGFWNKGIGHMVYDLAVITRKMLNMAVTHVDENVLPITMIDIPQAEAAEFFNKLQLAHEMRAAGKKGVIALEYDPNNPGSSRVSSEALMTPSDLIGEWQVIMERLDREFARLGIFLDDVDRGANVTATQILAEEESSTAFVKQVMEYNASESQFLIELIIDFIKKFIKTSDETPLNLTTRYGGSEMDNITFGAIADELRKHNYFVKINSRSGSIPSNVMMISQLNRQMAITPPESPAFAKLWERSAKLNDLDLSMDDFGGQPTAEQAQEGVPVEPTETDRVETNPYEPTKEPII